MWRCVFTAIVLVLASCQPEATPFPVDIPAEPATTPTAGTPAALRYALDANATGFVADIGLISASAQVEQLTEPVNVADLGTRYDLVAAYGDRTGWTRSSVSPHVALVVNTQATPLDSGALAGVVRRALDPGAILTELEIPGAIADSLPTEPQQALRTELANLGYPDGIKLNLAYAYTPGIAQVARQFQSAGIDVEIMLMADPDVRATLSESWMHLALVAWMTPEQRAAWVEEVGAENVIDLYVLPISYRAMPDLTISLSPGGWPIASR